MDLLIYLAKASLLLTLFWVVYKIVLENETYHRWKRIYLHSGYVLSLILPLLSYTKIKEIAFTPSFLAASSSEVVPAEIKPIKLELLWSFITENALIEILYISISLIFVIHLMVKFYKLLRFLKSSKAFQTDGVFHIQKSIPEGAFSFLNYIVYDPKLYSKDELEIILAHEKAHVDHKHSLDMLFAHLYKCVFWFNPFAWLYQKSLVLNLEYEADAKVVNQTAKKDYQMTLYSITQQQFRSQLQHSFHQSPIKKRIAMLNKNKHNQSFWKLFIVSPLLVVFFLLFQVETKAQIKNQVMTTENQVSRIEITYDENTTRETIESDIEFLKEEFNIDMKYSNIEFDSNGKLKSIALEVNSNDGFNGTVASPDVAALPVYFYRDYSEDSKSPFGVGTRAKSETVPKTTYESIKDAEIFIINGNKISKEQLAEKYIPVEDYSYDDTSKTLSITTRSDFSKPYYSGMFTAKEELNNLFKKGESDGVIYFKVDDDKVSMMTINNFKISNSAENASQNDSPNQIFRSNLNDDNIVYLVDGKEVDKDQLENIKPDHIESVDVKKSVALVKAKGYDPAKVKGIIEITTKKENSINVSQHKKPNEILKSTFNQNQTVIYSVDGDEVDLKEFNGLDPEQIQSMEVVKSPFDLKKAGYDTKRVDGLILITTKKSNSKKTDKIKIRQ